MVMWKKVGALGDGNNGFFVRSWREKWKYEMKMEILE